MRFGQLVLAINEIERLLEVPYPSPSVTMRRVAAVPDGFCGYNQLSYSPRYVGDPYVIDDSVISVRVDHRCDETFATIAHETAHTWFHGSDERADWIDEGLANAMERQVLAAFPSDEVVYPPVTYCHSYRNIRELEQADPAKVSGDQYTGFECNYTLGDGIFGDLSGHYGGDAFNRRIADLAKKRVNETAGDYTIGDVRRALGSGAASRAIINTWYEGNPEMRRYRHLDTVEWTFLPTIDGQYLHFVGKTNEPDMIHEPAAGEDSYCSQFNLYQGVAGQSWVANIDDPLAVGWKYRQVPDVVTINETINPETGEFSVTALISRPGLPEITGLYLTVRSRPELDGNDLCGESKVYSQAAVLPGEVPEEFKVFKHYHSDAIEWIKPPTIKGNTLTFRGKAERGTVSLKWRKGYCLQIHFYERDARGYHYIDSLNPRLPDNQSWVGQIAGEITHSSIDGYGVFNATASTGSMKY